PEKPKRRLLCPLWRKPMRGACAGFHLRPPFSATPGLQEFLSEGVFKCPEDQLPLDYAKIYPDPELEVQVLGLPIRCIHSEEGCRWSGPLRHLQGHLNTCSFNVVPCPNRCPMKLSRRDLPAHLQHDCPKRRLKCEFCGCDFSGEAYESSLGFGYPKFISHQDIRKRNYVRDDAVFIRAAVELPRKILS
uniref:TNF receptor associated factor 4 n=1 Tax=Rhinopithecus bieti TaxID=61621 RepID=A0A2K6L488_RHIBE